MPPCVSLEDTNQLLKAYIWLRLSWEDMYLTWDANEFDNITFLHVPSERLWLPDIVLYNNSYDGKMNRLIAAIVKLNSFVNRSLQPVDK